MLTKDVLAAKAKLKVAFLKWLSPLQMYQFHRTTIDRVPKGCGEWFLTSDRYMKWRFGTDNLLWCSGIRRL